MVRVGLPYRCVAGATAVVCSLALAGCSDDESAVRPKTSTTKTTSRMVSKPANGRLVFAAGGRSCDGGVIASVRQDGSGVRRLTHGERGSRGAEPRSSPDGRRITFTGERVA